MFIGGCKCGGASDAVSVMAGGNGQAVGDCDVDKFMQLISILAKMHSPGQAQGAGPADTNFNGQGSPEGSYSAQEAKIRENPELLREKGREGMDIEGMDLETGPDGRLTEESKRKVNALAGYLSDKLGVEVAADVAKGDDGKLKVHLTSGQSTSVTHSPPPGTIYSAHTHPHGSSTPSQTDLANQIPGAEDAVVPCDGIAGNEDGGNYTIFA